MCKRIILVFFITFSSGLTLFGKSLVPQWALNTVWYQIFPERFNNGDMSNDPTRNSLVSILGPQAELDEFVNKNVTPLS